jgi:hypothetical protein
MIEDDISHIKVNFWLAWSIANSIGLGFAWSLGELIGSRVADVSGWKSGQLAGVIIFEGILWTFRGTILLKTKAYEVLRPIEFVVWFSTELMGWIIGEAPVLEGSLMGITLGSIFAVSLGAVMWLIFWFMKIPKPRGKLWAVKTFLLTFIAFIIGTVFIAVAQTISFEIQEIISKLYFPLLGAAIAGTILGFFLGSLTGLALIKLMHWQPAGS